MCSPFLQQAAHELRSAVGARNRQQRDMPLQEQEVIMPLATGIAICEVRAEAVRNLLRMGDR